MQDQLKGADLSLRQEVEVKVKETCQGTVRHGQAQSGRYWISTGKWLVWHFSWLKLLNFVLFRYFVVLGLNPGPLPFLARSQPVSHTLRVYFSKPGILPSCAAVLVRHLDFASADHPFSRILDAL